MLRSWKKFHNGLIVDIMSINAYHMEDLSISGKCLCGERYRFTLYFESGKSINIIYGSSQIKEAIKDYLKVDMFNSMKGLPPDLAAIHEQEQKKKEQEDDGEV